MLAAIAILAFRFFFQAAADPTLPPSNAHAEYTVVGKGTQVYKCTAQNNTFIWTFQEPNADLFDIATNQPVGTHTAGPTWTWNDRSEVVGKLLHSRPSPDPNAIPWLLLEAHSTGEPGALSNIRFIRRSDTQAGLAPATGCDAQHIDNTLHVPYQATYTFYSAP